ncbi:retropepsin-like aspartic protease family protein [Aliidiomarina maris]|uniref:Aspartyl protease family protein n=1 Tax=Aliidiomarina maris TaxID=531312 RepID=A0A327WSD3_9GAMM|nr:retropepsin-like aspartic protease [Aliidiomarina maris]MCL5051003.1 retroviral-like aspartic protease family protein [Bacillota bacterium]RAJ93941.1 aspartyl protease family protein [Aliidiomarina maris]RUO27553.1 TIGR02281 family clan AA aspartic protease [Aliidiomarina maris]
MTSQHSTPDSSAKVGKWFAWFAWIALLAILYLWFGDLLERQQNPNMNVHSYRDGGRAVVELQQNRAGMYVANGQINGQQVTFMLDTGATQVAIPSAIADNLGLNRGTPMMVRTANGTARAYATRIDELRLGDIHLQNVAGTIVPGYQSEQILLGMSALSTLEFNQQNRVLTIYQ